MEALPPDQANRPTAEEGLLRAAFRDLHGARLHGFALLVTLGDRALAERVAAEALADGARRADTLRHPDRAAAWLRGHVLRSIHRQRRRRGGPGIDERRAALAQLGVDEAAFTALAGLDERQRATLVGGWIESLDPRDLEGVLRYRPAVLARMLARVRRDYLDAYVVASGDRPAVLSDPHATGPLARRIRAMAEQTMARAGGMA